MSSLESLKNLNEILVVLCCQKCYHGCMGYSYSTKAGMVLDELSAMLRGSLDTNNGIERNNGFWEYGPEQPDGAIVGSVFAGTDIPNRVIFIDYFRIESNGLITKFPTTTKKERNRAMIMANEKYNHIIYCF